ncbi:hypothetical protein PA598K_03114, partial [Paenibacillus sp. 598K]
MVQLGAQQRSAVALPSIVAADHLLRAVGIRHMELHEQRSRIAKVVSSPLPGKIALVPAVADHRADRVRPCGEQLRDIV